ncbi:SRPBCC family protein [Actinomadura sp. NPDC047616]|uniref:SRPBCC family protein n=1 Tax=Actinomadura sp. NPDC047616 TaxID=3155914 RepID=UPI0033D39F6A
MEWTGARYADRPTVEADTWVDAPPERVWTFVSDVELMPSMSTELQSVRWLDDASGPALGARFVGRNRHEAVGEWETTSHIVEFEPPRVFAWAVENPEHPVATWRFTLRPQAGGTQLSQWMQLGPARSNLSVLIDRMPEQEQQIVLVRMRQLKESITATLAEIKQRAETPGRTEA